MSVLKGVVAVVGGLAVLVILAGQIGWLRGTPPSDLGVHEGRLKTPSTTPNSVSSQAGLYPNHPMHVPAMIAPLALRGDGPATMAKIKAIVEASDGATVVRSEPDYLYAQFTSRVLKFVDDVEFWFDPAAGVIQVRSASRLGAGDMGANRDRVEAIRRQLDAR